MSTTSISPTVKIPALVRPVLAQITKMRASGEIDQGTFDLTLQRVLTEELEPHGLTAVVRELQDGQIRFLIKSIHGGTICDMIDCSP